MTWGEYQRFVLQLDLSLKPICDIIYKMLVVTPNIHRATTRNEMNSWTYFDICKLELKTQLNVALLKRLCEIFAEKKLICKVDIQNMSYLYHHLIIPWIIFCTERPPIVPFNYSAFMLLSVLVVCLYHCFVDFVEPGTLFIQSEIIWWSTSYEKNASSVSCNTYNSLHGLFVSWCSLSHLQSEWRLVLFGGSLNFRISISYQATRFTSCLALLSDQQMLQI